MIKTVSRKIEMDGNIARITPISDLHDGNNNCKLNKFIRTVDLIAKDKHHYWFGLGDWFDCILLPDKRAGRDDMVQTLFRERRKIMEIVEPIKDRCLGLADGNHEVKMIKIGVGSPIQDICDQWDIPYFLYSGLLKIQPPRKFHNRPIFIYFHHGASAGRKTGGAVNRVEELAQHWGADVYCVGHSHKLFFTAQPYIDWAGNHDKHFCNTGGFLETCTLSNKSIGYGEIAQYPPQRLGTVTITWKCLGMNKNKISITETEI